MFLIFTDPQVKLDTVCTTEVLQAFADGHLTIDLMDKAGGIMNYEADYLNMEQGCWASRRGLFLQVSRPKNARKN